MSETRANLEHKIGEAKEAISEAEAEVMKSAEAAADRGQAEVRQLIGKLKAWSTDAQNAAADAQESATSGLASFGDELLLELKKARAKLS